MNANLIDLNSLIAQASNLPALPQSTMKLAALVGTKQDNVGEVAEVVAFDPALTFKLIRAANSAFSGSSSAVTNVKDAVARLGTAQVFALAVATSVRPHMQKIVPEYGFSDGEFWRHSVAAAVATEVMPPLCRTTVPPESFTAALLHDIGKLIMARFLSADILDLLQRARKDGGMTLLESETKILKVHHGELGGLIAQHWKFPERIVKGIVYHHNPEEGGDSICDVVCLANLAAKQIETGSPEIKPELLPKSDLVERLGLEHDGFEKLCIEGIKRFELVKTRYNVK
jgi:putative nucleotidyltransferase with HDIG domain